MLIVHEVMGRGCGWLTAETARRYHAWVGEQSNTRVARRGILALRLDDSESARTQLAEIASDPSVAAELRDEALR